MTFNLTPPQLLNESLKWSLIFKMLHKIGKYFTCTMSNNQVFTGEISNWTLNESHTGEK